MSSAANRIALICGASSIAVVTLLGVATFLATDAALRQQRDAALLSESGEFLALPGAQPADLTREIASREASGALSPFAYALFDPDGRQVAGHLFMAMPAPGWSRLHVTATGQIGEARAYTIVTHNGGRLTTAIQLREITLIERTIIGYFSFGLAGLLALSSIGTIALARYLRTRLGRIADTAEAVIRGDLDRRMPVSRADDEFDAIARALNAMLDQIVRLMANLRQVSSDIAHDLRTPLVRLRGRLEALETSGVERPAVAAMIGQVDDALALFGSMLRIAEVEGGQTRILFETVELSAVLAALAIDYAPAVAEAGHRLHSRIVPGLRVRGERQLLSQAVGNLLDNALRHTPPGTELALVLAAENGAARLSVADNGPGAAPSELPSLGNRFYRGERSRSTPGHGLGLSLVRAVAIAHGFDFTVADNRPGLIVTITIPPGHLL